MYVLLVAVATTGSGQTQFEGTIESKNTTIDESGVQQQYLMTFWIKKNMVKVKTTSLGARPDVIMVYRTDKRLIWILNDGEKTYLEIQQQSSPQAPSNPTSRPDIRFTGRRMAVARYMCEEVVVTHGEGETVIWATKRLGSLMQTIHLALGSGEAGIAPGWTGELVRLGLFPLSSSTRHQGKVLESQEVTKVDERSLPASVFDVPASYRREKVRDMIMEGMNGGKKNENGQ